MGENPNPENEIIILSKEQIAELNDDVGKQYVMLETRISTQGMLELNPVMVELMELKKLGELKYDPEKKEESIESYKQATARMRGFAKKMEDAKKAIKGPLDEAGKAVLAIEKACISVKDKLLENLKKEFAEWEIEKANKQTAATEKRDAEKNQAITELSENNAQQLQTIAKGNLIQKLKFGSVEALGDEVNLAIQNFTKDKIDALIVSIQQKYTWPNIIYGNDITILTAEELQECKNRFENQVSMFISSLSARSQALALSHNATVQQQATEIVKTGMANLNTADPNYSDTEHKVFSPKPIHTTPVAQPVPVPIHVPVEVRPEALISGTIEEYKKALLEYHQTNVNTLAQMYNNFCKNLNEQSSDADRAMQGTMYNAYQLAVKANDWVKSKLV